MNKAKSEKLETKFHQAGDRFQAIYNGTCNERIKALIDRAEKIHFKIYEELQKDIEKEKR